MQKGVSCTHCLTSLVARFHPKQRMRQAGDWEEARPFDAVSLQERLNQSIGALDVNQARREVSPFVRNPQALEVWSQEFFRDVAGRIRIV
jgi:hypothetical protein